MRRLKILFFNMDYIICFHYLFCNFEVQKMVDASFRYFSESRYFVYHIIIRRLVFNKHRRIASKITLFYSPFFCETGARVKFSRIKRHCLCGIKHSYFGEEFIAYKVSSYNRKSCLHNYLSIKNSASPAATTITASDSQFIMLSSFLFLFSCSSSSVLSSSVSSSSSGISSRLSSSVSSSEKS